MAILSVDRDGGRRQFAWRSGISAFCFSLLRMAAAQVVDGQAFAFCRLEREIDWDRQNGFVLSVGRFRKRCCGRQLGSGAFDTIGLHFVSN
jgi:hypothetical protein